MWLREALIWKRLTHPNIVPFIGVTLSPLQIVSEWMPGGSLTAHIKSNPRVDRISLVSPLSDPPPLRNMTLVFQQLVGVAEGLNYLHRCEVVHGDLKGVSALSLPDSGLTYRCLQPNIMVDAHGRPRITDFGLALNQGVPDQTNPTAGGTARWTAPEILNGEGRPSKKADVFSFAMVMVEVGLDNLPMGDL